MPDPEKEWEQDLALRNAAKRLVRNSLRHVKQDFSGRSLSQRAAQRVKDGSAQIADEAGEYASQHRMQLGAGLVLGGLALAGWLFRDRLAEAMDDLAHRNDGPLDNLTHKARQKAEQLADEARSLID